MLLHDSVNMEQSVPENLSTHVFNDCEMKLQTQTSHDPVDSENGSNSNSDLPIRASVSTPSPATSVINSNTSSIISNSNSSATKVKLSFSVDRLLSAERISPLTSSLALTSTRQCCDGSVFACCTLPSCFGHSTEAAKHTSVSANQQVVTNSHAYSYAGLDKFYPGIYMDYKSVLRPTPIRAAEHATSFPTLATNALVRFHQQQQHHQHQQQQQHIHPQHQHKPATLLPNSTSATALLAPLNGLKTLQLAQQQRFLGKTPQQHVLDIPPIATVAAGTQQNGVHNSNNNNSNSSSSNNASSCNNNNNNNSNNGKRKRSWSRAVFTNLQRKGLEIQFQQQKYITKPDRRKLAARLNLTDAQVKVWFQNRRMKWRHTRENLKSGQEKQPPQPNNVAGCRTGAAKQPIMITTGDVVARLQEQLDYSSDSCSSVELSERADDDDNIEIDVVE